METIWGLDKLHTQAERSVLAIGVFDGVHLGHQAIMRAVRESALRHKACAVVVTFDRLPEETARMDSAPPYITTIRQKMALIAHQGLDRALVLEADRKLLSVPAEEFVRDVLWEKLQAAEVVVGQSFAFGRGRAGNVELLRRMGAGLGFEVTVVPPMLVGESIVSSTAIRRMVAEGDVETAASFLGRPFALDGRVVPGKGLGRKLGFPTANTEPLGRQIIPANGVYAVEVAVRGIRAGGAASIGTRPTLDNGRRSIEVYIIGFSDEIYGEEIEVSFRHRLRGEIRFPNAESLVEQIRRDVDRAGALLSP
ncbi:MAG: bifunctional riboflavin kinase/FAD synthetase [Armatimonadetes bacterium]|nr:bifunctional riboflavin kinase/FAD synthetase [Armatimonadota bacterium]